MLYVHMLCIFNANAFYCVHKLYYYCYGDDLKGTFILARYAVYGVIRMSYYKNSVGMKCFFGIISNVFVTQFFDHVVYV